VDIVQLPIHGFGLQCNRTAAKIALHVRNLTLDAEHKKRIIIIAGSVSFLLQFGYCDARGKPKNVVP